MTKILAESLYEFREINKPVEELNEAMPKFTTKGWVELFLKDPNNAKAAGRFKKAFEWQLKKLPALEAQMDLLTPEQRLKFSKEALAALKADPGGQIKLPWQKTANGLVIQFDKPVTAGGTTASRRSI